MSLVSVADVQARKIGLGYTNAALQSIIDGAEAELAQEIGALTGERTEVLYPRRRAEPLWLRRPADSGYDVDVVVDDNGTIRVLGESIGEYRLVYGGYCIELVTSDWQFDSWGSTHPVSVTYTPSDEARVREAVIDLVREELLGSTPYVSERIGEYSYSLAQSPTSGEARRNAIFGRFKPRYPFRSERLVYPARS